MNKLRKQRAYAWARYYDVLKEQHEGDVCMYHYHQGLEQGRDETEDMPLHFLKEIYDYI